MERIEALVISSHSVVPDGKRLAETLDDAGWPALPTGAPATGTAGCRWVSDDGVHVLLVREDPAGLIEPVLASPRLGDGAILGQGRGVWRVSVDLAGADPLSADLQFLQILRAVSKPLGAIACRLEGRRTWHGADDLVRLVGDRPEPEWPGELLVDLRPGPLGPESLAVLSEGLVRYGLVEVMVVGDRHSLADAWQMAVELIDDRLLGAEPSFDLQRGPHPSEPLAMVDVAFVDGAGT